LTRRNKGESRWRPPEYTTTSQAGTKKSSSAGDGRRPGHEAATPSTSATSCATSSERAASACLEVGCGTGVHAAQIRELGWTPAGVDLSAGMLRRARGRLPIAQADAERLPVRDDSLQAVVAMMAHTDMPGTRRCCRMWPGSCAPPSWTDQGVRAKVGATHHPLPELMHAFLDAGLRLERFAESGERTPVVLAVRAQKYPRQA